MRHLNYSSKTLRMSREARHAILRIDGKVAAFCSGYLRAHRYIVPRLSINTDFKFYSPGIVLLDQLIEHAFRTNGMTAVDLALGTEKYKLQMGAKIIKSYNYVIG